MRILHVLPSLNSVTGGPATAIPLQLSGLARLGHYVEMFTTQWPEFDTGAAERVYEDNGVVVRVFPATSIWPLNYVPYSRGLITAVHGAVGRFDIYHASSLWNPLITHTLTVFRRYRLPYTITCHGMLDPIVFTRHRVPKWFWGQLWERHNVEEADLIHFTSEQELLKAQTRGWRLRSTLVMPLTIDTAAGLILPPRVQLERDYPQLAGKQVITFVGRINWVKNLDLLIAALSQVRRQVQDAVLLCVGPDSDGYRAALELQARELGIGEQVVFTGLLKGDALMAAYARADVVALVSRKENFGIAAAEALSAGVPIVLSDGVDMGMHWSAPPVWRVEQNINSIAQGLTAALAYARETGVPCLAARQLSSLEWGQSQIHKLSEAFEKIVDDHRTIK